MKWLAKAKNILDENADVLVCSANVSLNLSGGVGAELLGRYGPKMQSELHKVLSTRTPRAAYQGEVVPYIDPDLPYEAILHAVAVDGWYHTTPEIVENVTRRALALASGFGARKVALTALGTSYGDISITQFASAIRPLLTSEFHPIEEVCVCILEDYRVKELTDCLFRDPDSI